MKNCLDLQLEVKKFISDRNWGRGHNAKNLSASIGIEAAELMEIFQWLSTEESDNITDEKIIEHIGEEIADVIIYCICLANKFDMDISDIVMDKLEKNAIKYPVE